MPRLLAVFLVCAALPAGAAARGRLEAAAGKVDITPDLAAEKTYLAGFGAAGKRPEGVHDPLYARLLVLRRDGKTVALAGLDLIGFYHNDVLDLRRRAGYDAPGRYLFVASTHEHSGPDTLGLWGPFPGVSGVNQRYRSRIKRAVAAELKALEGRLRPVDAAGGRGVLDPRGLCRDLRDPQAIDANIAVLRLSGRDGKAVATVVNWACHPETLWRENRFVSADYPGALCARVEEQTGGACLFFNGMIGGLLSPDSRAATFDEAKRIGTAVADAALALPIRGGGNGLAWRSKRVLVPLENPLYRVFLPTLVFGHDLLDAQGRPLPRRRAWTLALRQFLFGLAPADQPWIESEVAIVDAGPARLLGMPAEPFPELAVGGYDGRYAFGRPLVAPGHPDPPDLGRAPKGPYLRDLVRAPVPMLVGLANDELGYLVPEYDFKTSGRLFSRRPGHHEEVKTAGPSATKILLDAAAGLLRAE
ncbi:MAG: hypothetical protein HY552_02720 [Elusimicrobia bacterium]|nr:hypothetical protein [Elusimicrobiota bacterium]